MDNNQIVVGSTECPLKNVFILLRHSAIIRNDWSTFARLLDVPSAQIETFRRGLNHGSITHEDLLFEVLEIWIGRNASRATLSNLLQVVEGHCGANDVGELLRLVYKLPCKEAEVNPSIEWKDLSPAFQKQVMETFRHFAPNLKHEEVLPKLSGAALVSLMKGVKPPVLCLPESKKIEGGVLSHVFGPVAGTTTTTRNLPSVIASASTASSSICIPLSSLLLAASEPYRITNPNDFLKFGTTLDPSDAIHAHILEYINNSQEDDHRFGIQVKKIFSIERKNNHGFCELLREGKSRMMLWHGTSVNNLCSIIRNGFVLPPPHKTGLLHGRGIYFADRASKSAQFCGSIAPGQDGILILCEVIVGRSYISTAAHHDWTSPPSGFDSVTCVGEKTPSPTYYKSIDGVIFPSGRSRENSMLNFNEYVVYNPDQVDVKFVVTFTFTKDKHHNIFNN